MKKILFTLLLVATSFSTFAQDEIQQAIFTDDEGTKYGHVRGDQWDEACYSDYTIIHNRTFVANISAGTYFIKNNITGVDGITRPIASDLLVRWTAAFNDSRNSLNNVFPLQANNTVATGERAIRATN